VNAVRRAVCLFVLCFSLYAASYHGVPTSDDEQLFASVAASLAHHGEWDAPQLHGNARLNGEYYGIGPLHPLLAAPLVRLAARLGLGQVQAVYWLTPLYTALTAVLVYALARRYQYGHGLATLAALLFGFGTLAWPYSRTFFREPLAMLCLTAAWYCLELGATHRLAYAGCGLCLAALLFSKEQVALAACPAFLYLLAQQRPTLRTGRLLAGLGIAGAALVSGRLLLPDNRFTPAFLQIAWQRLITTPHSAFFTALAGSLVSPGKGLLIYNPLLLLAALPMPGAGRTPRRFAWLVTSGLLLLQALAYDAGWWNVSWGTRYLLPAVPLLVVAALPALEQAVRRPSGRVLLAAALLASLLIQAGGVLVADPGYQGLLYRNGIRPYPQALIWLAELAPLVNHLRLLQAGTPPDLAAVRARPAGWLAVIPSFLLAALAAWGVARPLRRPGWLLLAAAVLPFIGLYACRADPHYSPRRSDLSASAVQLTQGWQSGDAVLIHAYLYPAWYFWCNTPPASLRWYSLPIPGYYSDIRPYDLDDAGVVFIENLSLRHTRIWLLVDEEYPHLPPCEEEKFLRTRYTLLQERRFLAQNGTQTRLLLFDFTPTFQIRPQNVLP